MRKLLKLFFLVVLIVGLAFLFGSFLNQNSELTKVAFFKYQTEDLPKGLLLGIVFSLGVFFSALFFVGLSFSKMMESARLRRENIGLQRLLDSYQRPAANKIDSPTPYSSSSKV